MLKKEIKQELISKIKANVSINKIAKEMSLAKSTIYHYYRKTKGRKYKIIKLKPGYSEKEGEVVGIFAGDGSQHFDTKGYKYQVNVHFGGKNLDYALYVQSLFESYFGKKFRLQKEKGDKLRLKTESKVIFNYFRFYLKYESRVKHSTMRLKSLAIPKEFKKGMLRGLIDTDGCVHNSQKESRIRIAYTTTSKRMAQQFKSMCSHFGIESSVYKQKRNPWKDRYTVQLMQKSVDSFLNTVKPFKGKKLRAGSSAR